MLARAESVKVAHSSEYIAGAVGLDLQNGGEVRFNSIV